MQAPSPQRDARLPASIDPAGLVSEEDYQYAIALHSEVWTNEGKQAQRNRERFADYQMRLAQALTPPIEEEEPAEDQEPQPSGLVGLSMIALAWCFGFGSGLALWGGYVCWQILHSGGPK